ncbi:MAG: hypothetical protein KBE65_13930 [Phycisphaerae bacterium]|nr:hypothetical protein [Phycisphaerae bacterium]
MVGRAALVACILLAGGAGAYGEDQTSESLGPRVWKIAPEVSRYKYREPGVMTNEGTLYGVVASCTFHGLGRSVLTPFGTDGNETLAIEGRLGFGEVDYEGSDMDTGTPISMGGNDDFLIDLRVLLGSECLAAKGLDMVYAGLGYRYLNDDSSSQLGGYERESNYLYIPLGLRPDIKLTTRWTLSPTCELDILLIGHQISHLSDADPQKPTVRTWQWPGFGAGLFLDLRHRGRHVDFALAPFLRYWWLADSSTSEGYYEPENNTFEYGLSLVGRF